MRRPLVRSPLTGDCLPTPGAGSRGGVARVTHGPRFGVPVLCFLISVLALPAPGSADPLGGTVVGKDGNPKPYVRIDIIGPQKSVVLADENGRFAVDVPQGRYKVRVTDNRRRMDFDASSPSQGKKYKLSW